MKDSSGNIEKLTATVKAVKPGFQVLSGSGTTFRTALKMGATGAILAFANAAPYACVTIWEAFRTREYEAAEDWQKRIFKAARLTAPVHGIPGLKHAMDLNGYYGGPPRLPLVPCGRKPALKSSEPLKASRAELQHFRKLSCCAPIACARAACIPERSLGKSEVLHPD